MKLIYCVATDILRIRLNQKFVDESNEVISGVIVDVDGQGQAVGFEILDASKRMKNPAAVELEVVVPENTKKRSRRVAV